MNVSHRRLGQREYVATGAFLGQTASVPQHASIQHEPKEKGVDKHFSTPLSSTYETSTLDLRRFPAASAQRSRGFGGKLGEAGSRAFCSFGRLVLDARVGRSRCLHGPRARQPLSRGWHWWECERRRKRKRISVFAGKRKSTLTVEKLAAF